MIAAEAPRAWGQTTTRGGQPSVETNMALLFRTLNPLSKGQVVVGFDPAGGWAEACANLPVPCVTFVGPELPDCVLIGLDAICDRHETSG